MKKLRLDWEAVVVESFATLPEAVERDAEVEALSGPLCGTLATRLTCCPCTPRADGI